MRKHFLILALAMTALVSAQVLEVQSIKQLPTNMTGDVKVAGISPKGDYILLTDGANRGLTMFKMVEKTSVRISDAEGAGYNVKISGDGKELIHRETVYGKDRLRRHNIIHHNFVTQRRAVVAQGQRNMAKMNMDVVKPSITINNRLMELTINGITNTFAPNGNDKSYIWPSISPDGTKICYFVTTEGCYVCNIDGSDVRFIGRKVQAAKWYDNNTLVAMASYDDGHVTTASSIVAYTLDGKSQVLTDDSMIAMYPYTAKNAIVFSTLEGETYIMNVK
ncbi:MAG: hypothetical protein J6J29_01940 [Paludibacteraceae bacterium]|nr:hypothetical protein [Paludibacteraceae bacterium]